MIRVWRLSRPEHSAFDGEGSRRIAGRWHRIGATVIYTSEHLSLAALEFFVNINRATKGSILAAVAAEIPDDIDADRIRSPELPAEWRTFPRVEALQNLGMTWLERGRTAVLVVPSAVIPQENNYLLNPTHTHFARIRVLRPESFSFDPRMWR